MDPQLSSPTYSHGFKETWKHTMLLSLQSIGVIYGRLSTAPLYVFGSIPVEDLKPDESAYEYFSFIFWTLTIVSLLKYAFLVLRADDDGEGGPFALYSLLCRHAKVGLLPNDTSANEVMQYDVGIPFKTKLKARVKWGIEKHKHIHYLILFLALFGSCMVIGDAMLTPAISVMSASSGLQRLIESLTCKNIPVPVACAILVCLFALQHYGSHKIGFIFAPVIIIWLFLISGVGVYNVFKYDHQIVRAISPVYIYRFMRNNINMDRYRALGSVILCVAGSEAMFADLGHFSRKSIKITFISLIYPVLILCYAGQAAFISHSVSQKNLNHWKDFNHLSESVPLHIRHVFIVLSLLASAVGSQATITACFSIIKQCLALGCFPRVEVIHTSNKINGQVYIPDINWLLMVLSLGVTIGFHDTAQIGYALGTAIVLGMLVTTCLMSLVIALHWEKSLFVSASFLVVFGSIEAMYLSSCILNFHRGAWFLIVLSVFSWTTMLAWHYGTQKKYEFDLQNKVSTEWLTDLSPVLGVSRVPGIGFIYTDIVTGIPAFFSHFITNLPAFHQVLIFVSFKSLPVPFVSPTRRYLIGRVGPKENKIFRCIVRYGYCDGVKDTDDFEEQIIRSIGEFISLEENDLESLTSPDGRMIVVGKLMSAGNASIPLQVTSNMGSTSFTNSDTEINEQGDSCVRRKKVQFLLPANSPRMRTSVRDELQELIDARESGTAYLQGHSHLAVREGSSFLKQFLIRTYVFLDKNCREPHMALNIPHAALVEVSMVYVV
ncbi:hypothetical protein SLA2020_289610 [Shorea laevis]